MWLKRSEKRRKIITISGGGSQAISELAPTVICLGAAGFV